LAFLAVGLLAVVSYVGAEQAAPLSALARIPVKEITVFKDGHAFVLHEGSMPVDAAGNVQMDYLPTPVLGTFWPYSSTRDVKLSAVIASPRRVMVERTVLSIRELLDANPGLRVNIAKTDNSGFDDLTILPPLTRSSEELESTNPPGGDESLPVKGDVLLVKGANGTLAIPYGLIKHATFQADPKLKLAHEEFRNLLTLKLDWPNGRPGQNANVGLGYLQRGFRWIPGYRVAIDGKGNAAVKLQATMLNELADVKDITANLVIGVPTFDFKDTPDPIGLQDRMAQLSRYFQEGSQTAAGLSNAIMSQSARMGDFRGGRPAEPARPVDLGPEVAGSGQAEDLYVFTVRRVTLQKGQRMVMPVTDYALKYKDVYTLDLPFAAPPEIRANVNSEQQAELARLLMAPKAEHKIRLTNSSKDPLTTAPALIVQGERVLGQGMMTYTSAGGNTDLRITTATDIRVKKEEKETGRIPNAIEFQNSRYLRVNMTGTVSLTNFKKEAIDLEVTRYVLGTAGTATNGGAVDMINWHEEGGSVVDGRPYWWNWYNWPYWWTRLNGIGRFKWNVRLDPGKTIDLGYTWHYFTQ
jgi:hypothetical protein